MTQEDDLNNRPATTPSQATDNEMPTGMAKNWNDPMPMGVTEYQGQSAGAGPGKASMAAQQDMPEWKKHIIGGSKGSFGRKTNMSILEQRQSLPIYKLKDELIKAINDNQV